MPKHEEQGPSECAQGIREVFLARLVWMDGVPFLRLSENCCLLRGFDGEQAARPSPTLRLDPSTNVMDIAGHEVRLTRTEFRVVSSIVASNGRLLSIRRLVDQVWGYPQYVPSPVLVRAHVRNIRTKLQKAGLAEQLIQTVRGVGYRLSPVYVQRGIDERNRSLDSQGRSHEHGGSGRPGRGADEGGAANGV